MWLLLPHMVGSMESITYRILTAKQHANKILYAITTLMAYNAVLMHI